MPGPKIQRGLRRAARALPPDARVRLRRTGGLLLRQLPKPVAQEIRGVFGVRWGAAGKRDAETARDALGLTFAYGFYAVSALLSLVFVLLWVPETKGVELEEMTEGAHTRAA